MWPDSSFKRGWFALALLTSASTLSIARAGGPVYAVPATDAAQIRTAIGFCLTEISRKAGKTPVVVEGPCADTRGAWSGAQRVGNRTALSFLVSNDVGPDAGGARRSSDSLRLVTCEVGGDGDIVHFHQRPLGGSDVFSYPSDLCSPPGTDYSARRARYAQRDR